MALRGLEAGLGDVAVGALFRQLLGTRLDGAGTPEILLRGARLRTQLGLLQQLGDDDVPAGRAHRHESEEHALGDDVAFGPEGGEAVGAVATITLRLRGAGILRCDEAIKDADGKVIELRCTLDPDSRPGMEGANRKVKGTIHWVGATHAVPAQIRLYDRLFTVPNPDIDENGKTYRDYLNPDSRKVVTGYVEPAAADCAPEQGFQFERLGYFVADRVDSTPGKPVFNRIVTLKDSWVAK